MTNTPIPAPKAFFKSKTVVANLVVAIGGVVAIFHPGTQAWIASHADGVLMGVGMLNMLLRSVTHGKIALVDDTSADGL